MPAVAERKKTSLRLNSTLLDDMKRNAAKNHMSLNSYVESLLFDATYYEPNKETREAIEEARSGKYAGVLDVSSLDAFLKCIDEM